MGCCMSTSNKQPIPNNPTHRSPPPFLEEETVKEVLSETPTPKPNSIPKFKEDDDEKKKTTPTPVLLKIYEEEDDHNVDKKPLMATAEEISEICSLTESLSTTTVTEKIDDGDDDGEVRQRVVDRFPAKSRHRSFSGDFSARRERTVGNSPARRVDSSPGRVRMVPGRGRPGLVADGRRRDAGESSGRRSRSPANRTDGGGPLRSGLGRSPSSRRSGKSPGRVQPDPQEKTRNWPPTTNESLENPLVSLECFIFL